MRRTIATIAALASLACAAPAAADSIAFVDGGDVHLTTPDGSRTHRVTTGGGYSYVSQADDGTLIALYGRDIRRLDRVTGAVTAHFSTPVSATPPGAAFEFRGPLDPVISPDGKRIAYGYNAQYTRYDPYCGYYGGCREGKVVVGTGYSHADRLTGWDEPGFKQHSGWQWPSWMDSGRVLITDPAEILNKQFWVDPVGDDAHGSEWFRDDQGNPSSSDAEATRQGTGIAAVEGYTHPRAIHVWKMNGAPPAEPSSCMYINMDDATEGTIASPSWSPDGRAIAFAAGPNVEVIEAIDLAGCDPTTSRSVGAIASGSSPDWGPAAVPAVPQVGGGGGGGAGGNGAGGRGGSGSKGGSKGGSTAGRLSLAAPKAAKLRRALRGGVALTVRAGAAGRLRATAAVKGGRASARAVASGSAKVGASGRARVKLRFKRRAARALRGRAKVVLAVKVTFRPAAGGPARRAARTLTLRR